MKISKILFVLFIALACFSSCKKETLNTEIKNQPTVPEINVGTTNIQATIDGFISDRNGEIIADATVRILNASTQTNELGYFEITGLVNEESAVITVEKPGYFNQYKTITPTKSATNRTRIQLTEKSVSETITSSQGGLVTIDQGSSVQFQPNSFIDQQGNTYTGNVQVYSFFIDPTDENIDQYMPGNLTAINAENEEAVLQSFGMVKVLLEGDSGQRLNINKAATLNIAVPFDLQANAPAELPLWYFDENTGLWIEEGNATLQNGMYIGDVEHFTFWNCDVPSEAAQITGQTFDSKGISILKVRVTDLSTGASFTDWTNTEGGFNITVPKNVSLLLEVFDVCGTEVLLSTNIGPFTDDQNDLGTFNLSSSTSFSLVTGTLVDCDQTPISNGSIIFNIPTSSFYQQTTTDAQGSFSALVPTCDLTEIEFYGIDPNSDLVSSVQTLSVSPNIDAGVFSTCVSTSASLGTVEINLNGVATPVTFNNCKVDTLYGPLYDYTAYWFTFYEDLGNGDTVTYVISITDNNNDINNPDWNMSPSLFTMTVSQPDNIDSLTYDEYEKVIFLSSSTITVDQSASAPGELLKVTISNCLVGVKEYVTTGPDLYKSYTNSSITLTGVIQ